MLGQESVARTRKIVHVDMDAFYASVEQRDNPSYRGKPLVVGGSPNQRGVVAAASYEARKFGIYSAMPSVTAIAKCPGLIFVRPRFDVYREISTSIHAIFKRYTDLLEGVALDEAYLDVTENKQSIPYASTIARHIKTAIFQETQLTATAGVSINKFLAKMASGQNKPNGLTVILPEQAITFVEQLPIEKFHGIGEVTAAKMHSLGIHTGADLKIRSLTELTHHFGKAGHYYYKIARAEDDRLVEANRVRKSIGAETSFAQDLSDVGQMLQELEQIAQIVEQRLEQHETRGRTLTLKVKFSDYQQLTRSKTMLASISELSTIFEIAKALFESIELENRSIRLLGISLSNLDNAKQTQVIQLPLFQNADITWE
ncbi:DNA polymerase IV [Nostoc sp. 'Peltigera membranacea cyanobiont' 213]|uniref:DNA polymerase IV n=1 Tax=Nostoc sp. 'Peltigera membranacea cyanobiont' 213 TaxID=2014530 RepID=UPI000B95C32D|nr:DNA polymerase IV [Nostoc sp. 'Peltigera membranacea cyanobiont' 213]OYD88642.1 DNA polymerase IV [Nostoc sp. 'Peltigera membranacea cyanobiont' 213]